MKVNIWKSVDVEAEAEVSLDDCIQEMLGIADEDDLPYRKLIAIDGATRILEKIPPDLVDAKYLQKNPRAVQLIRDRLQKWMDRLRIDPAPAP